MTVLVVGQGSIGKRHRRTLSEMGCRVAVVSAKEPEVECWYKTIPEAIRHEQPRYVVIANETSRHHPSLCELAESGFKGTVLVEKPIFETLRPVPRYGFQGVFVAYNLRFHPIVRKLRNMVVSERTVSMEVHAGQFLPGWRPGIDYRSSYSARRIMGGGVLRDLSHELDYLNWMLGGWIRLVAAGGHMSRLEIDSDDVCSVLLSTKECPMVTIHLNYLDRPARRQILVNTDDHTIEADLLAGYITIDGEIDSMGLDLDFTYVAQHRALLSGNSENACTLEEGLEVVSIIDGIERSIKTGMWVHRT